MGMAWHHDMPSRLVTYTGMHTMIIKNSHGMAFVETEQAKEKPLLYSPTLENKFKLSIMMESLT